LLVVGCCLLFAVWCLFVVCCLLLLLHMWVFPPSNQAVGVVCGYFVGGLWKCQYLILTRWWSGPSASHFYEQRSAGNVGGSVVPWLMRFWEKGSLWH
jgi:hypothetical protein